VGEAVSDCFPTCFVRKGREGRRGGRKDVCVCSSQGRLWDLLSEARGADEGQVEEAVSDLFPACFVRKGEGGEGEREARVLIAFSR